MKYLIVTFLWAVSLSACANEKASITNYKSDCYDRGWNCHKISENEKAKLQEEYTWELAPFVTYFEQRKGEYLNEGVNRHVYWEAVTVCRKIALIEPDHKNCGKIHTQYLESIDKLL